MSSRYLIIDALRGIAAFLVVLYHTPNLPDVFPINIASRYGYIGVYLFFVISGFCIHLRFAKNRGNGDFKIDAFAFWKRRVIRLYPAYIATIVLFLAWQYSQGKLEINSFFVWDMISHLLMIHNLDNNTVYSMNGVFWTLAIEEQLYALYFLLLYLRNKFGWMTTMLITFAARFFWLICSVAAFRILGYELPFTEGALSNWWIWAMGAFAVELVIHKSVPGMARSAALCGLFLASAVGLKYLGGAYAFFQKPLWILEPLLWGFGFFILINRLMEWEERADKSNAIKACAFVGLFSYSLYLTHELVLEICLKFPAGFSIVAALIFAYVFYLIFEKPFVVLLRKPIVQFQSASSVSPISGKC